MSNSKKSQNPFDKIPGFAQKGERAAPAPAPKDEIGQELPAKEPTVQGVSAKTQPTGGFVVPTVSKASQKSHAINVVFPEDIWVEVEKWFDQHPGHTVRSMLFCGLKAIGVEVDESHLTPKVARSYKKRAKKRD